MYGKSLHKFLIFFTWKKRRKRYN